MDFGPVTVKTLSGKPNATADSLHCVVDLADTHTLVYPPHSVVSLLHRPDSLDVDIRVLDRVHLYLQGIDVLLGDLQVLLELLLPLQSRARRCKVSQSV